MGYFHFVELDISLKKLFCVASLKKSLLLMYSTLT